MAHLDVAGNVGGLNSSGTQTKGDSTTGTADEGPSLPDVNLSIREPDETGDALKVFESLGTRSPSTDCKPALFDAPQEEDKEEDTIPLGLPFGEYLVWAVYANRAHHEALEEWQSVLFHFVRLVKAHPNMAKLKGKRAFSEVEKIMRKWQSAKKLAEVWAHFMGVDRDVAQAEFCGAWDKVRCLPGSDPFEHARDKAEAAPIHLPRDLMEERPDAYEDFIGLAGWLQVIMGPRPILLPVERLAELMGVTAMTISRYRTWAKSDGFLKEVSPAVFRRKSKGKATEFVFNVACCKMLAEKAQNGTAELFAGPT